MKMIHATTVVALFGVASLMSIASELDKLPPSTVEYELSQAMDAYGVDQALQPSSIQETIQGNTYRIYKDYDDRYYVELEGRADDDTAQFGY